MEHLRKESYIVSNKTIVSINLYIVCITPIL